MLQLTINGTSWMVFRDVLDRRESFRTYGNLRGQDSYGYEIGRLPSPYREEYCQRGDYIDYVVYSYATPLAWHDTERGWIMPDTSYSTTTSKAQGRILPGIKQLNAKLTCPECGADVWDGPEGSKLAQCWNAEAHGSGAPLAFDTMGANNV